MVEQTVHFMLQMCKEECDQLLQYVSGDLKAPPHPYLRDVTFQYYEAEEQLLTYWHL